MFDGATDFAIAPRRAAARGCVRRPAHGQHAVGRGNERRRAQSSVPVASLTPAGCGTDGAGTLAIWCCSPLAWQGCCWPEQPLSRPLCRRRALRTAHHTAWSTCSR